MTGGSEAAAAADETGAEPTGAAGGAARCAADPGADENAGAPLGGLGMEGPSGAALPRTRAARPSLGADELFFPPAGAGGIDVW